MRVESWKVAINSVIAKTTAAAHPLVAQETDLATIAEAARAYESDVADFCAWGSRKRGAASVPASAETVALYVTNRASRARPAASGPRLVAINVYYKSAGYDLTLKVMSIQSPPPPVSKGGLFFPGRDS